MRRTIIGFLAACALASLLPATAHARQAVEFQDDEAGRVRQERYRQGQEALDAGRFAEAADTFGALAEELAAAGRPNADAALYWQAWALSRQSRKREALAALRDLARRYPDSVWLDDARALEVELERGSGSPGELGDEELKLYAVNGLMNLDPERAIPVLEEVLAGDQGPKVKERALFVLSQSGEPRAYQILARVAREGEPDERRQAIQYLGMAGTEESRELLSSIYEQSGDRTIREGVLQSYMISGDTERLARVARTEADPDLRKRAIQQLGVAGAGEELAALFDTESNPEMRRVLLDAFFLSGEVGPLARAAREETDGETREFAIERLGLVGGEGLVELRKLWGELPAGEAGDATRGHILHAQFVGGDVDGLIAAVRAPGSEQVRRTAIRNLGLAGGADALGVLHSLYREVTDGDSRRQIIEAYFLAGDVPGLVGVVDAESDTELKRYALQRLSMVDSPEASEYLLRVLRGEGS